MVLPALAIDIRETVTGTLIVDVPNEGLDEMGMDIADRNFEIFYPSFGFYVFQEFPSCYLQSAHFRV